MARRYICNECRYVWDSRKRFSMPSICPHCRSKSIEIYSFLGDLGLGGISSGSEGILRDMYKELVDEFNPVVKNELKRQFGICNHCGRNVSRKGFAGQCQKWTCKKYVCNKCAKSCSNCNKIFCVKHINSHEISCS